MFRITHSDIERSCNIIKNIYDTLVDEWINTGRLDEPGWDNRYQYEAQLAANVIQENNFKTVLEIGGGPGVLSQYIQKKVPFELTYHLIDKPSAKKYFNEHKFKGTFFVKDISIDLDTDGLLPTYDLIICNDVLEHLLAPTNIIKKVHSLMGENTMFIVSVPNWRMGHQFIYRGLWDYDNFLYFMYIHEIEVLDVYPSPLVTPDYPKLDSESAMPDELRRSWNFYFVTKKRITK